MADNHIYFSDFFNVDPAVVDEYGAMDISLLNDLPLFIDPFLIFCSDDAESKSMHDEIIRYLVFLRDRSVRDPTPSDATLRYFYCFPEVKQTYLGFCQHGNAGSGLGIDFARALHSGLHDIFQDFGKETITKGTHIEKVCLLKDGVGRDNISDFITNLIKAFLLNYTEIFAKQYLLPDQCREFSIHKVLFDYNRGVWVTKRYYLPCADGDYVVLTPVSLLVRDDIWINRKDMIRRFPQIATSIPDDELRERVNEYFVSMLSKNPKQEERDQAAEYTLQKYPAMIDYYIRHQEDHEEDALQRSESDVSNVQQIFIQQVTDLVGLLKHQTDFYRIQVADSYNEAMQRILYLKQVVEDCDGYRWFYNGDQPIRREADLHLMYKLACYNTLSDENAEVNNGRGPVDFKLSNGRKDQTIVEFKLVKTLKRNLEKQVEVYTKANDQPKKIVVIMFFTDEEHAKVLKILNELNLTGTSWIVTIDARSDKVQASKA